MSEDVATVEQVKQTMLQLAEGKGRFSRGSQKKSLNPHCQTRPVIMQRHRI
jgi:hypothetical protein